MITSYHVHTKWSDGSAKMSDYIQTAIDAELDEVGFSDHYALLPDGGSTSWSMPPERLGEYLVAIQDAAESAPNWMTVRAGLEVDFIPASLPDLRKALQPHSFDYIIGSVHIVNDFVVDGNSPNLAVLPADVGDQIIRDYWTLIREMTESRLFDIAGHLDVIEKGGPGFEPSFDVRPLVSQALESIRQAGMAVELNTSGWYSVCGRAFPRVWILTECLKLDIPVLITADAHRPQHIARDFARARKLLEQIGYHSTAGFAGRQKVLR